MSTMGPVQTYTGFATLDLAAIGRRVDNALAVWYMGRTVLKQQRKGYRRWIRRSDLHLDIPRTTWKRSITKGVGIFWDTSGDGRIWLHSPARVAAALGVQRIKGSYMAPLTDLTTKRRRRARLAMAGLADLQDGWPITLEAMARKVHRHPRTVRRWQRRTRWPRKSNVRPLELLAGKRPRDRLRIIRRAKEESSAFLVVLLDGKPWLALRGPNTLGTRKSRRRHGGKVLKRHNRMLNSIFRRRSTTTSGVGAIPNRHRAERIDPLERLLIEAETEPLWVTPDGGL